MYHTIQNLGGRKFWQNGSYQKLVDNILANAHANYYSWKLRIRCRAYVAVSGAVDALVKLYFHAGGNAACAMGSQSI